MEISAVLSKPDLEEQTCHEKKNMLYLKGGEVGNL